MYVTTTQPKVADVLDLVRVLRRIANPIKGELASVVANIIHQAKIDNSSQLGNAYFRCPDEECETGAHDCEELDEIDIAFIMAGGVRCEGCGETFTVDDLRISEGWVEQL